MSDSHHAEGHDNRPLLREKRSLGEILETATGFERTALHFYQALAGRVQKPIRDLVSELAAEEARHYELFQSLAEHPDIHARILDMVRAPESDSRFSDMVQSPSLDEFPDDQSVLQYAMAREQAAMEQYASLAAEELPEPARDLFHFLANEELKHKKELERRYAEMVYGTNV